MKIHLKLLLISIILHLKYYYSWSATYLCVVPMYRDAIHKGRFIIHIITPYVIYYKVN